MTELIFDAAKLDYGEGCWLKLKLDKKSIWPAKRFIGGFGEKRCDAALKQHREKRSTDANAYFWTLCGALAAVVGVPKDEIYLEYVRQIGNNFIISTIPKEDAPRYREIWKSRGTGWLCEDLADQGEHLQLLCYYGSSVYDTAQMHQLIELVVFDCKEQGIETKTPDELDRMVQEWDG